MLYFIQTSFYAAILYLVYLIFMKNKTGHSWSRVYLLMNMVLPFILPLVQIKGLQTDDATISSVILPVVSIGTNVSSKAESIELLPAVYMAVSFILLGYLLAQALQLVLFLRRHTAEKNGNVYLLRGTGMGPGSWFNYIFIPAEDASEAVMKHERAHILLRHSYDIIFSRLLLCFAWPNLMLWLIVNELKTVHEFQADAVAGTDNRDYSKSLLNELFHTKHFTLTHTFSNHQIKRRIMMLQNNAPTGKMKVVVLSLLTVTTMLYVQCSKDMSAPVTASAEKDKDGVYTRVDKMPEFSGGNYLSSYMADKLQYPESAIAKNIEGIVQVRFIVDESGNIKDPQVTSTPDAALAEAALAAVKGMPKWKPGENKGRKVKVYCTLPVSFMLNRPKQASFENSVWSKVLTSQNPAYAPVRIYAEPGC
jgi:TonB family protein